MLRRSTVVWQATGLGAAVGVVPYVFIGMFFGRYFGLRFGLATVAFGLVTGALPGLVGGVSLAASRKGARTRRWAVRASLVAGAVFFLENALVMGLTHGPAFFLPVLFGTPVAVVAAALAASGMARKVGEFAWIRPEEYPLYYRLDRAKAHRRADA
ncbi:hypothetical protein ACFYST_32085 [Kitasatospora sp. NPDC004614]|uniref:hypothetical protein n=1 Tax=unclassified Kitasatospora TaxID=2633591 RepID=UPI0036945E51